MHTLSRLAAVLAVSTLHAHAVAEELFPSLRDEPIRLGVGFGGLLEDEGYVGVGTEVNPVPVLLIQYKRFRLFGSQAELRFLGDDKTFLGLRADYKMDGYEQDDSAIFAGMAERKPALSFGLAGRYATSLGDFSFDAVQATSSERGLRAGIYYNYPMERGKLTLLPRIGLEYFDADFVSYYYGVRPEEATAVRPAFEGGATFNVDAGIDLIYGLGTHHFLLTSIKYRAFGNDIKDSPLIESSGSPRVNIGYLYRF